MRGCCAEHNQSQANIINHPSWILRNGTGQSHTVTFYMICGEICVDLHFQITNKSTKTSREEWEDGEKSSSKKDKCLVCIEEWWEEVEEEKRLTSELLSNHQKKVNVLVWLGQTTAVRLASFPLTATMGAERYTRSSGPAAMTNTPSYIHTCIEWMQPARKVLLWSQLMYI